MPTARELFPNLIEVPQVGRPLSLFDGHQEPIGSHEITFLAHEDMRIVL